MGKRSGPTKKDMRDVARDLAPLRMHLLQPDGRWGQPEQHWLMNIREAEEYVSNRGLTRAADDVAYNLARLSSGRAILDQLLTIFLNNPRLPNLCGHDLAKAVVAYLQEEVGQDEEDEDVRALVTLSWVRDALLKNHESTLALQIGSAVLRCASTVVHGSAWRSG
jgi:hypothetical protein